MPRDLMKWGWLGVALAVMAAAPARAQSFPKIGAAEVAAWQERGEAFLLVDVRPAPTYEARHARGAIGIPAFAVGSRPLPRAAKVVLYDAGAGSAEAEQAARSLQAKGHPQFWILDGGLTAWEAGGFPIVAAAGESAIPFVEPVSGEALLRLLDAGEPVLVIDLREADRHRASRVPTAVSAPDEAALDRTVSGVAPTALIVLYDEGDGSAEKRGEALRRRGFRAVKFLYGGMPVWREKNLRVDR